MQSCSALGLAVLTLAAIVAVESGPANRRRATDDSEIIFPNSNRIDSPSSSSGSSSSSNPSSSSSSTTGEPSTLNRIVPADVNKNSVSNKQDFDFSDPFGKGQRRPIQNNDANVGSQRPTERPVKESSDIGNREGVNRPYLAVNRPVGTDDVKAEKGESNPLVNKGSFAGSSSYSSSGSYGPHLAVNRPVGTDDVKAEKEESNPLVNKGSFAGSSSDSSSGSYGSGGSSYSSSSSSSSSSAGGNSDRPSRPQSRPQSRPTEGSRPETHFESNRPTGGYYHRPAVVHNTVKAPATDTSSSEESSEANGNKSDESNESSEESSEETGQKNSEKTSSTNWYDVLWNPSLEITPKIGDIFTSTVAPGAPCNCLSSPQYDPVCGTDNQTYKNPKALECARLCNQSPGVQLDYHSACLDRPPLGLASRLGPRT